MNRLPAFAAFALALSTLCACDPGRVMNHMAKGDSLAAPQPSVCTVAQSQDDGCPPPAQAPNTNH